LAAGPELVHGSCVAFARRGVLLRGRSGSGKSDLALRLLAMPPGPFLPKPGVLIGDDQLLLERRGDEVIARGHPNLRGKFEVRGLGILELPCLDEVALALVVDLADGGAIERLPDPELALILDIALPRLALAPFEASAPLKVLLRLAQASPTATP
jgi:serine kinase of HPr protein (carbohydrate metabolism regulator)